MALATALVIGVTRGLAHALEADHVAAVATFAAADRTASRALRSACLWGAGHAAAVLGLGGALVASGVQVPAGLARAFDAGVVVLLVWLGISALRGSSGQPARAQWVRFTAGLVHGLSGTAALTIFLAMHVQGRAAAIGFLGVFGVATLAAMIGVGALLGWSLRAGGARVPAVLRAARIGSGLASLVTAAIVARQLW